MNTPGQNPAANEKLEIFHRIISDQLNARLAESPKFFWAVVAVGSAYGYALWEYPRGGGVGPFQHLALILISTLAFGVALLAEWYLAALGYGFRFLQATQVRVEKVLEWHRFGLARAESPGSEWKYPFWLLPSIYLPHAIAFGALMVLVALGSGIALRWASLNWAGVAVGVVAPYFLNAHYHRKFRQKTNKEGLCLPSAAGGSA